MPAFTLVPERPEDSAAIDAMVAEAFGPDRFHKTVYKFRDGVGHMPELAFVALDEAGLMQASIRYWPIEIGGQWPAILLGPVTVRPEVQGKGMGKALIRHTLDLARSMGHRICVLVGDRAYYEPFGFHNAGAIGLELPGWVDQARFQVMALQPGALQGVAGMIGKAGVGKAGAERVRLRA